MKNKGNIIPGTINQIKPDVLGCTIYNSAVKNDGSPATGPNNWAYDEHEKDEDDAKDNEVNSIETNYDALANEVKFDPEAAERAKQEVINRMRAEKPRKMMGTKEKWGYKIPENKWNSLVSAEGTNVKNHWADENEVQADWNYDENKDPED